MRQLEFRPNPSLYNFKEGRQNREEDISHPSSLIQWEEVWTTTYHQSPRFICITAKTRESPNAGTELGVRGHRVAEVQVGWKQDTIFQLRLNLPPKFSPPEKTHGRQPPQKLGLYSWLGSKVVELRSCTITNLGPTSARPHKDNIIQNCIYR